MFSSLRTLATLLVGRLQDVDAHVHFHRGPQGHPAACHEIRCEMPRLTV
jgi:hypothetical protein